MAIGASSHPLLRFSLTKRGVVKSTSSVKSTSIHRIQLRPLTLSDAPCLLALINNAICQQLNIQPVNNLADAQGLVLGDQSLQKQRLGIWHPEHGLIGSAGYSDDDCASMRTALLFYWLGSNYQNQGVGSQVLQHLISELQHQQFDQVFAEVFEDNLASVRLLKKSGFILCNQYVREGDRKVVQYYLYSNHLDMQDPVFPSDSSMK